MKFWRQLYKEDYRQLASVALALLVTSINMRNYIKNEFCSRLAQQNLNASIAVGICEDTIDLSLLTQDK